MKKYLIVALVVVLVAVGAFLLFNNASDDADTVQDPADTSTTTDMDDDESGDEGADVPVVGDEGDSAMDEGPSVIGESAGGEDIVAHHYGEGDTELLLVGGIHGGYSWNTSLLAYRAMDYLEENSEVIPDNVRVTVIPVLNPDGLNEVVGTTGRFSADDVPSDQSATVPGRFNANGVDLNRNFDCNWQSVGMWQDREVDAGNSPFSEPESQALRAYVRSNDPSGVVIYYSAFGGVFSSACQDGILDETSTLTDAYAEGADYPSFQEYDFYSITGDAADWLAKEGVPAISVLLSNHTDIEWEKNRAGIEALLNHYSN